MKFATPIGATSGKRVQVSLPAVVSMMAVEPVPVVAAGLATDALGFVAGAGLEAGVVCDMPATDIAAISKQIDTEIRMGLLSS
jgi:hypothetical protein